jgi:hypothetical protein
MNTETQTNMASIVASLVAKVGIDAAIIILTNLAKVVTIDDAIAALEASRGKTWEDYKKEA